MKFMIGTTTPPRREAEAEGAGLGAGRSRSGSDTGPRDRVVALPLSTPGAFGFGNARWTVTARVLGLLLVPLLTITAARADGQEEGKATELARFERFAGEPIPEVRNFELKNFEVLGRTSLAVWGRPGQVYLLSLSLPCTELQWARSIVLHATHDNMHIDRDYVIARGQRCYIETIRPVDEPAMRAARRAETKR